MKVPAPRQLSSGSWFIQLRLGGESISVIDPDKKKCIKSAEYIKAEHRVGKRQTTIEAKSKKTLGQAIDDYIAGRSNILSPSTIKAYKSYRNNRFQTLMEVPINTITAKTLQQAINQEMLLDRNKSGLNGTSKRDGAVSPKLVNNAYGLIRSTLSAEDIDINFSRIKLPETATTAGKTLSPSDIGRLIKVVDGDSIEIPVLLAVWLGLRRSEIAALKKSNFDFENKTVTILAAKVQDENNEWVEKTTKTKTSTRTLPCPDYILDKVKVIDGDDILTLHPNTLYTRLKKVCERNNLPTVRFHDLRHCAASVMLLLNIPDKYAMERGGWASKQTMTGRYQHTISEEAAAFGAMIDSYYLGLLDENANKMLTENEKP